MSQRETQRIPNGNGPLRSALWLLTILLVACEAPRPASRALPPDADDDPSVGGSSRGGSGGAGRGGAGGGTGGQGGGMRGNEADGGGMNGGTNGGTGGAAGPGGGTDGSRDGGSPGGPQDGPSSQRDMPSPPRDAAGAQPDTATRADAPFDASELSLDAARPEVALDATSAVDGIPPTGLRGEYHRWAARSDEFNDLLLVRYDQTIDFDWGMGSPDRNFLPVDNFSVRWTGKVTAAVTDTYVFTARTDDGVRVWVNGVQVINVWRDHAEANSSSAGVALMAGVPVDIQVDYYEHAMSAVARLSWSRTGAQTSVVVPASALSPPPVLAPDAGADAMASDTNVTNGDAKDVAGDVVVDAP